MLLPILDGPEVGPDLCRCSADEEGPNCQGNVKGTRLGEGGYELEAQATWSVRMDSSDKILAQL